MSLKKHENPRNMMNMRTAMSLNPNLSKYMNMMRMNFGIEHGNQEYRRNILKRNTTNERMISYFRMTSGKKYITIGDLIVGMPEENRELIFDSIEFTRQLPKDVERTGAFIFAPYHGTPLRELAIKKGYIKNG